MDREERLAALVVFGTFEGGTFDWSAMVWRQDK
jgi:hypothetical protein